MATTLNPTNQPEVVAPEAAAPAAALPHPEAGIGLCLSGGGYRAMLFHVGALWRLNELGLLPRLKRLSSVSGGSIVAAYLGLRWPDLDFDAAGVGARMVDVIVADIRELARHTIDVSSIAGGLFNPFSHIADQVRAAYAKHLYGAATLQALPAAPAPFFVINATNVQTGALWRFSRAFMGDNQVRSLRKRLLIAAYQDQSGDPAVSRKGAYWGIRTDISQYGLADAMTAQCPLDRTRELAEVLTRLAALTDELQERLINWGYAVCDAAVRRHWLPQPPAGPALPAPQFPYPRGV